VVNFGFKRERIPENLTIALGTGEITPMELARAYAVFANGGFLIEPYVVSRIEDYNGKVVYRANPLVVCQSCEVESVQTQREAELAAANASQTVSVSQEEAELTALAEFSVPTESGESPTVRYAPRAIRPQNAWLMTSILQDVISQGTAAQAKRTFTERTDLAGKTGTTNGPNDAWFSGYMPNVVTTTWVGFDQPVRWEKRKLADALHYRCGLSL
jgi:penicillin-binding protein 1A